MMWAYFSCHRQTFFFCQFYHTHAILCRAVAQMQAYSGLFGQQDIPRHNNVLHRVRNACKSEFVCFRIRIHHTTMHHIDIFAVRKNDKSFLSGCLHTFPVKLCVHN